MPHFSNTSKERLATAHIDHQTIWKEVIKTIDCSVLCGHRTQTEQTKVYQKGLSKVQWPNSKHNSYPSMAVDVAPYFSEVGGIDWHDAGAFYKFAGRVEEIALRLYRQGLTTHVLRHGGDWDGDGRTSDQSFHDLPHFELVRP